MAGAVEAQAAGVQKFTGGFVTQTEGTLLVLEGETLVEVEWLRTISVSVNVVQHKDGSLTGGVKWNEEFYVDGELVNTRSAEGDADEAIFDGNKAYIRVGGFYFLGVDGGEGSKADPDVTAFLIFPFSPAPSLAAFKGALDFFLSFLPQPVIKGNLQVKS